MTVKEKVYKISNGKRMELKGAELQEHKNIVALCADNLEDIKYNKIEELMENTKKIFYEKYPLHKQCNIAIFGTEEEKEGFKKFHDEEVAKHDERLEAINSCDNLEQLRCL